MLPPLEPRSLLQVMDGAFDVLRTAPRQVLGLTLLVVLPVQLVVGLLQRRSFGADGGLFMSFFGDPELVDTSAGASSDVALWVSIISQSVLVPLVGVVVAVLVSAWHRGETPTSRQALAVVVRRSPILLVVVLLGTLARVAGALACGVGALLPVTFLLVTSPVVGAEGLGPLESMKRSYRLTKPRFFSVLGAWVAIGAFAEVVGTVLGFAASIVAELVPDDVRWVPYSVLAVLVGLVVYPFVAAATTLEYFDLRSRVEGVDLDGRIADQFPNDG